ncbi:hypothetical protein GCM10023336_69130 [Streptomyces similanensis]|uniref:Uncharacterized protein n=1 Tax=Streptomyces similanensis TaxID=1274988 RepID=A0ABP9LKI6_9ACTN
MNAGMSLVGDVGDPYPGVAGFRGLEVVGVRGLEVVGVRGLEVVGVRGGCLTRGGL